jgi:hypothetical protein
MRHECDCRGSAVRQPRRVIARRIAREIACPGNHLSHPNVSSRPAWHSGPPSHAQRDGVVAVHRTRAGTAVVRPAVVAARPALALRTRWSSASSEDPVQRRTFVCSSLAAIAATSRTARHTFGSSFQTAPATSADVVAVRGDGTAVTLTGRAVQDLQAGLRGRLLLVTTVGYETARHVLNPSIDRRPAVIVQTTGVEDVRRAVMCPRTLTSDRRQVWRPQILGNVDVQRRHHDRLALRPDHRRTGPRGNLKFPVCRDMDASTSASTPRSPPHRTTGNLPA